MSALFKLQLYGVNNSQPISFAAAIAPDESTVCFDTEVNGKRQIGMVTLKSPNNPAKIIADGIHPYICRNGNWFFFERNLDSGGTQIWRRPFSMAQEAELLLQEPMKTTIHDVSGDGEFVIVQTIRQGTGMASLAEFRLLDTRSRRYLSNALGLGACLLGDGNVIFGSHEGKGLMHRTMDGEVRILTTTGAFPSASPDERRILYLIDPQVQFTSREWAILDLTTQKSIRIGRAVSPVFSGDSSFILFLDPSLNGVIWKFNISNGSREQLGKLPGYLSYWTTSTGGTCGIAVGAIPEILIIDSTGRSLQSLSIPTIMQSITVDNGH